MKNSVILTVLLMVIFAAGSCTTTLMPQKEVTQDEIDRLVASARAQLRINEPSQRQDQQPLVLAHYMPWFQKYGYHWTEGSAKHDPGEILPSGRANIIPHYYPLTGNYDSADPVLLEYQVALMKMAGIDGVIFDWYGITEGVDYKPIHEATMAMIEVLRKWGMKYTICYEDQSIKHLIEFGVINRDEGISTAKETFEWMEKNWFVDEGYVKVDGRPLVLCFGPQHFGQKSEWDQIWAGLSARPFFIDLDARTSWADGAKSWSPMHMSSGGRLTLGSLVRYMNEFYQKQQAKPYVVGTAMPGFHDVYAQAGKSHGSYGFLDYNNGETFKLTWDAAEMARANVIQIQTWNDYGEGTIIEPTIERGYKELEFTQEKRKERDPSFPFTPIDLRIPIELFKILSAENVTDQQKEQVAEIYNSIIAGDVDNLRFAVRMVVPEYDLSVRPMLLKPSEATEAVSVFDPAGKKNLALGKPVVASSRIDVYAATRSVDGDVNSYWEGGARAYPGTLQVDLGSQEALGTIVIKLNPNRMWAKRTQAIEVKVSNDGAAWTTAVQPKEYIFDPTANSNSVVITLNAETRHVQLVFTANSGATNGQVAEFEIYGR